MGKFVYEESAVRLRISERQDFRNVLDTDCGPYDCNGKEDGGARVLGEHHLSQNSLDSAGSHYNPTPNGIKRHTSAQGLS